MRLTRGAGYIAGAVISIGVALSVPAAAQNYQANTGSAPLYNAPAGSYQGNSAAASPLYNTNPRAYVIPQQGVPGVSAPSYSYNNSVAQPYNNFGGATTGSWQSGAPLSPDQVAQIRAARDRQAQEYERQYQQARAAEMSRETRDAGMDSQAYDTLYNNLGQQGAISANAQGRERRVVYREENNPLKAPPRLFNVD